MEKGKEFKSTLIGPEVRAEQLKHLPLKCVVFQSAELMQAGVQVWGGHSGQHVIPGLAVEIRGALRKTG